MTTIAIIISSLVGLVCGLTVGIIVGMQAGRGEVYTQLLKQGRLNIKDAPEPDDPDDDDTDDGPRKILPFKPA